MNQERMRCILFQWSERPMGVGLSSKHWALGSHSFSAEQARRAGESVPLPASQRRCVTRAHIHPQQQVRAGTLRARSPAQTRSGETLGFKLALVWFLFYSPETFFFLFKKKTLPLPSLQLLLREFCNWVVLPEDRPLECAAPLPSELRRGFTLFHPGKNAGVTRAEPLLHRPRRRE